MPPCQKGKTCFEEESDLGESPLDHIRGSIQKMGH